VTATGVGDGTGVGGRGVGVATGVGDGVGEGDGVGDGEGVSVGVGGAGVGVGVGVGAWPAVRLSSATAPGWKAVAWSAGTPPTVNVTGAPNTPQPGTVPAESTAIEYRPPVASARPQAVPSTKAKMTVPSGAGRPFSVTVPSNSIGWTIAGAGVGLSDGVGGGGVGGGGVGVGGIGVGVDAVGGGVGVGPGWV